MFCSKILKSRVGQPKQHAKCRMSTYTNIIRDKEIY